MTERFEIRPSKILVQWIIAIHLMCALTICWFSISVPVVALLLGLLGCSVWWQIKRMHKQNVLLEYNYVQDSWRVTQKDYIWINMIKVQPIYVNTKFVWLNFFGQERAPMTVIVGADSLDKAKYLQLRRSVICPAVLKASSS